MADSGHNSEIPKTCKALKFVPPKFIVWKDYSMKVTVNKLTEQRMTMKEKNSERSPIIGKIIHLILFEVWFELLRLLRI